MSCSRDAKPQDGPLPCRAFIIFATLVGIAWVLLFWRKPVRINAIGINPRPSVQNRAVRTGRCLAGHLLFLRRSSESPGFHCSGGSLLEINAIGINPRPSVQNGGGAGR